MRCIIKSERLALNFFSLSIDSGEETLDLIGRSKPKLFQLKVIAKGVEYGEKPRSRVRTHRREQQIAIVLPSSHFGRVSRDRSIRSRRRSDPRADGMQQFQQAFLDQRFIDIRPAERVYTWLNVHYRQMRCVSSKSEPQMNLRKSPKPSPLRRSF